MLRIGITMFASLAALGAATVPLASYSNGMVQKPSVVAKVKKLAPPKETLQAINAFFDRDRQESKTPELKHDR